MRLDALCRYRVQAEDEVRLELAQIEARLQAAAAVRAARQRAADQEAVRYLGEIGAGLGAIEAALRHQDWEARAYEVLQAGAAVAALVQERDAKQAELSAARRDRKQMEMLIQRRTQERQALRRRREQREMDDFANGRWAMAVRRDARDREESVQ